MPIDIFFFISLAYCRCSLTTRGWIYPIKTGLYQQANYITRRRIKG